MSSSITHTGVGQVSNTNGLGYAFSFATLNREDIQVEVIDPSNNIINRAVYTSGSGHYTIENYLEAGSSNAHIKFLSETARGFTNSQTTYKVRIKRQTPTVPKVNFTAGSSITASDLNTQGKQAFHLSEENRDSINSLAAGDATGAIQISGSNIADNSITTDKILDLEVKSADISSSSSNDSLRAITTDHIRDGAVTDAKLATGITGSKVTPNFGNQNIVTTGTLGSDDITITGSFPALHLTDNGDNPDYSIKNLNGTLAITDNTNSAVKFQVDSSDGHVDLPSHVDIGGGADVTGNLSVSGNVTLSDGNDDNSGLFFPNTLGGIDDKAFLRYYSDTGNNGDTRLHLGCLGDSNDEIYLQSGLVHTSGNFTVNGTCTATSFVGNFPTPTLEIARLSSNLAVNNSSWQTKLTLNITPSTSGTTLFVNMNGSGRSAMDDDGSVKQLQVRLRRGSTVLVTYQTTSNAGSTDLNLSFPYKDSYSHNGNQVTYTIQARYTGGGDDAPTLRSGTNIVVQEIL